MVVADLSSMLPLRTMGLGPFSTRVGNYSDVLVHMSGLVLRPYFADYVQFVSYVSLPLCSYASCSYQREDRKRTYWGVLGT